MSVIRPNYYIINEDWFRLSDLNTTGTRDKFVVLAPDAKIYYFKASLHKVKDGKVKEYPTEFWSEIVASQLGEMLKLPVLRYDIASHHDILGCISPNMIKGDETITEGVRIIAKVDPSFPSNFKNNHHLSLIHKSLASYGIPKFRRIAIEMLLFDCIIGNTDRHSENWALIKNVNPQLQSLDEILGKELTFFEKIASLFNPDLRKKLNDFERGRDSLYSYVEKELNLSPSAFRELVRSNLYSFAPFYDNGSSLGRELSETKISEMLIDGSSSFYRYFNKGCPDIIVSDKKMTFNATIEFLLEKYPEECAHFIYNHLILYNKESFSSLINEIDLALPHEGFDKFRLTEQRKRFFVKIIDSRINYIYSNLPL